MYDMLNTRPDLSYVVSLLSIYISNFGLDHWYALKNVIAYVNATVMLAWLMVIVLNPELTGFVDANFAFDRD